MNRVGAFNFNCSFVRGFTFFDMGFPFCFIFIYSSKSSITSLTAEATAITTVKRANGDILSSYNWTKPTIIYWFKHIY